MLVVDMRKIGEKLYRIRKRAGMTREEVAEAADISERTYADIERGSVNMRTETILRICAALHITPDEIFTEQNAPFSTNEEEIIARLKSCSAKDKKTALRLLDVYLKSLTEIE